MNTHTSVDWQPVGDSLSASGEAPVWHPTEERLYWVDPLLKRVWRHHTASGLTEHWDFHDAVTGVAPCRSGGLLIVTGRAVLHAAVWKQIPSVLATLAESAVPMQLRGGRCDPWGRYWLSAQPAAEGTAYPATAGSLLCLPARKSATLTLTTIRDAVVDCHGWSWSPDGRLMVWCATARGEVEQAGMSLPGSWPPQLGMAMTLAHFRHTAAPAGRPRSGAMDRLGRYWVAMAEAGVVHGLDGRGQIVQSIATPAWSPQGLCFGGPDQRTLFVTTARAHRPTDELAQYPWSGKVLALRVETPGMPTALYWD